MPGLAIERLETLLGLKFILYVASCTVQAERCAFGGICCVVSTIHICRCPGVLCIDPKNSFLSIVRELAQSVQKNIEILKMELHVCGISLSKTFSLQR